MSYRGDIRLGDTIDVKFCTVQATGAPTTLAGSPVISAYPNNSTTQLTAGITLTVDFDAVTGLNNVRVVASGGNGYATASNYDLVITTGTVNSVSVVGYVVASFSIECRSALMPVTAARTLVVDAAGLADANAVKLGPTGSGTAQTARDIGASVIAASVTAAVSLSAGDSPVLTSGTATAGGASTITLQTAIGADSLPVGCTIKITSGTGAGQARGIITYVNATKVLTVDRAWTTAPDATSVYAILYTETPKLDSALKIGGVVLADTVTTTTTATNLTNAPTNGDLTATMKTSVTTAATAATPTAAAVTARVTANTDQLAGQTVSAAAGVTFPSSVASPTNITAATGISVGTGGIAAAAFAANAIGSSAINTDAIASAQLAASAVTKIWANSCTEPVAAVAASPTALAALSWLLTQARNKLTQSSTTQTLLADDGATTIAASTVSDDGTTATRGKFT